MMPTPGVAAVARSSLMATANPSLPSRLWSCCPGGICSNESFGKCCGTRSIVIQLPLRNLFRWEVRKVCTTIRAHANCTGQFRGPQPIFGWKHLDTALTGWANVGAICHGYDEEDHGK